nr:MAG TPA_asm: hypothetical protein [Caudoviricetes sp.]
MAAREKGLRDGRDAGRGARLGRVRGGPGRRAARRVDAAARGLLPLPRREDGARALPGLAEDAAVPHGKAHAGRGRHRRPRDNGAAAPVHHAQPAVEGLALHGVGGPRPQRGRQGDHRLGRHRGHGRLRQAEGALLHRARRPGAPDQRRRVVREARGAAGGVGVLRRRLQGRRRAGRPGAAAAGGPRAGTAGGRIRPAGVPGAPERRVRARAAVLARTGRTGPAGGLTGRPAAGLPAAGGTRRLGHPVGRRHPWS